MHARSFLEAVERGDADAVAKILATAPELRRARDENGISALLHALYRGHETIVRMLRHDALDGFEAAALGDVEALVARLHRDDMLPLHVNGDGFTALHLAAWFGQPATARLLIATGADVDARAENETGMRPLHAAVAGGSANVVEQLLVMGADPNLPRTGGYTPLHGAAAHGREAIVRLLLEHGANRRAVADDGHTPASLALLNGHERLLPLLA